jgi:hypothetical protein
VRARLGIAGWLAALAQLAGQSVQNISLGRLLGLGYSQVGDCLQGFAHSQRSLGELGRQVAVTCLSQDLA